eukprot:3447340-Prymnesium_polylepis.1
MASASASGIKESSDPIKIPISAAAATGEVAAGTAPATAPPGGAGGGGGGISSMYASAASARNCAAKGPMRSVIARR